MKYNENCQIEWDFQDIPYGEDERQKIDILIPKGDEAHALVYIHGGAYFTGNKSQYPSFLSDYSRNIVVASIDYRVIDANNDIHMGDILSDINRALIKINELSNAKGVNIRDFILIGHSAGGHIALLYGYKQFREKIKTGIAACISMAGPTDFTDDSGWSSMTMWGETVDERLSFLSWMGSRLTRHAIELKQHNWTNQDTYSLFGKYIMEISPIQYVNQAERIPPTLLIHARGDDQVPYSNALRLNKALDHASVPHKLITPIGNDDDHMLGGESYSEFSPTLYKAQGWVTEAKEWLEIYVKMERING
jgi:acetyl esterase/lipase